MKINRICMVVMAASLAVIAACSALATIPLLIQLIVFFQALLSPGTSLGL